MTTQQLDEAYRAVREARTDSDREQAKQRLAELLKRIDVRLLATYLMQGEEVD